MSEPPDDVRDVVIVGGGPGGLAAGIYLARANRRPLVVERGVPGGAILLTWQVVNYPGYDGRDAQKLASVMEQQARGFGCEIVRDEVRDLRLEGEVKELVLASGKVVRARGVILACGARPKPLGVPGEKEFLGRGVSYCGTCDGAFFQGVPVAVVGGGDTAVEEAVFLTRFASEVHLIHRRDKLRASTPDQRMLKKQAKVHVVWDTVVEEVLGDASGVTGVRTRHVKTGQEGRLDVKGAFIFVGIIPNSDYCCGKLAMDEWGFIKTDERCRTSLAGVYAAGDVRSKEMRQITNAVGEGATAAWFLDKELGA